MRASQGTFQIVDLNTGVSYHDIIYHVETAGSFITAMDASSSGGVIAIGDESAFSRLLPPPVEELLRGMGREGGGREGEGREVVQQSSRMGKGCFGKAYFIG